MDLNTIKTSLDKSFEKATLITENEQLIVLNTKYAKEKEIKITSPSKITKYVEKPFNKDKIKTEYIGEKIISYKTEKGTKLGEIKISYNDELVDIIEVKLDKDLHFSLWVFIKDNILVITIVIIVFLMLLLIIRKSKKKRKRVRKMRR